MTNKTIINLRGINVPKNIEKEFIDWFDNVHVPMLLASGHIRKVTRFTKASKEQDAPLIVAIFEFDDQESFTRYGASPELAAAIQDAKERWGKKGFESVWRFQYEQEKSW